MGSFSAAHWLVVLVVCLLIFGPSKLGSVGEGLGAAIRNFKKGLTDSEDGKKGSQLDKTP